mmetsp:Transcript_29106/g.61919  ORF Transcript_29106/g.61919 Transcript_29106/m.61919 type:complete len:428 (+) Transcript_29106:176-1459(+)
MNTLSNKIIKSIKTPTNQTYTMNTYKMRKPFRSLLFTLLYIMHIISSTANGSSSPMTMFTPPSQFLIQQRSLSMQRSAQFDYRKSHQKSSVTEPFAANNNMNGYKRRNARTMPKIKSPSNSYNQFYKEGVLVGIEGTSSNSRRISGEIIMDIPIDAIWNILTDYDNLSTHVPNLVESKVINNGRRIVGGRPRVYQRGSQGIFGFEFGADVTLDMTEHVHHALDLDNKEPKMYSIDFECVDSQFFSQFDGSWILEECPNSETMVRYIVDVKPKGPVPVAALEWRIKEDVPVNILAVSKAANAMSIAQRGMEESIQTIEEVEPVPTRIQQSPPQPQSNRLRQLTDQAAYNLKQTAKSVLPIPVVSTARQAIRAMVAGAPFIPLNDSIMSSITNGSARTARGKKKNRLSSKDSCVDWYADETMAMYLKDS